MATKAVLYRLKQDGTQPYKDLEAYNLTFNGGLCEKNWVYLGIVTWTLADMQKFATQNTTYDFKVVTKTEAVTFFTDCLPDVITYPTQPTKQEIIDDIAAKIP